MQTPESLARVRCGIADVTTFASIALSSTSGTQALADHAATITAPMCEPSSSASSSELPPFCDSLMARVSWCAQEFWNANCDPAGPRGSGDTSVRLQQPQLCTDMRQIAEGGGLTSKP
jgi:hypothetical protein